MANAVGLGGLPEAAFGLACLCGLRAKSSRFKYKSCLKRARRARKTFHVDKQSTLTAQIHDAPRSHNLHGSVVLGGMSSRLHTRWS